MTSISELEWFCLFLFMYKLISYMFTLFKSEVYEGVEGCTAHVWFAVFMKG